MGCASSAARPTADGIARLQQARASRPNDATVVRQLGIAYYKADRLPDARTQLSQAVRLDPRDGTAALYLGLTAEKQNDIPAAKAAYQTYMRYGRTSKVRRQLENRLAALTRQELRVAAKSAVAQEQQLATQAGNAKTVAVMPLRFTGSDTTLRPLERGFAELITIDLARSSQLVVVERARIQSLLDEIGLQQSGQTDQATNVRAGKIIQAGRIVSGQIAQDGTRLRVDAAIVNTQTSALAGGAATENTLEQLFAIEKAIVLQLFDSLGVRLTTAERRALEERPTRSIQAFLAYSRGLRLEDQGQYEEAARNFRDAVRIDPGFSAAQQKGAAAQAAAVGAAVNVNAVEASLVGTSEGDAANKAQQGEAPPPTTENSPSNQADNLNQSQAGSATNSAGTGNSGSANEPKKDAAGAALGGETRPSNATVRVIVKLPLRTP